MGLFVFILSNNSYSKSRENSIKNFTSITKLPGLALSNSYLENRLFYYDDFSNILYPQMKYHDKNGFVYAK